jgi:hypothetical protein
MAVGLLGGAFPAARPSGPFFQRNKIVGVTLVAIIALEAGTLGTVFAGVKFGAIGFVAAAIVSGLVVTLGLLLTRYLLRTRARGGLHSRWRKLALTLLLLVILAGAVPQPAMGAFMMPMYLVFVLLLYYVGMALYVTWKKSLTDLELDPMLASLRSA